ncbi:MAG TPA: glycosyltransferase, partial [Phycisphaerae bacterium]|nr:glycosyltransferase [Phycisphaerae bacterium]
RITVSGMPIQAKWTAPLDRAKVLAEWRLPPDRPIIVLAAGADFTCGPVVKIARRLLAACEGAFVAVLAGRNKKLLGQLSLLPGAGRDLAAFAFTDRVHELVEVCTLMVTKAGGLSTAECVAKARPMVLLKPVPGQEKGNAAYFAEKGAAVVTAGVGEVVEQVRRLLARPDELKRMSDNARRLHRPATATIAAAIQAALGPH